MSKKKFTNQVVLIQKNGFNEVIDRCVVAQFYNLNWAELFMDNCLAELKEYGNERCYLSIEEI